MELVNLKQALDKAKDQLFESLPAKRPSPPLQPSLRAPFAADEVVSGVVRVERRQPDLPSNALDSLSQQIQAINRRSERRLQSERSTVVATSRKPRAQALRFELTTTRCLSTDPLELESNRVITAHQTPALLASYKMLRTRVLQKMRANKWKSLAVVTARQSQGGSLTAVNLAISLAQEVTHSVLLADFNFRRPGLHQIFGIDPPFGIGNFLFEDRSLSDILVCPAVNRLVLLPCLAPIDDASELLNSPRMLELVDELSHRYEQRLVIFDVPAVLEGDEVLAFAPNVDAVLLVVEENTTAKNDVLQVVELLKDVPLLGTVLNKSRQ
jgi:protein-tyrosine kinase